MHEGLEGVVAARTRLSEVDGEAGRLTIGGYAVEDLAPHASFEEVTYLLFNGRLPEPAELRGFIEQLLEGRTVPGAAVEVLRQAAAVNTSAMDALRMAVPLLSLGRPENGIEDAIRAIAAFPSIVATYWR